MYEVKMDFYQDWIETAKKLFASVGQHLPEDLTDEEVALRYFLQNATIDKAVELKTNHEKRMNELQNGLMEHLETMIIPDIRKQTDYQDNQFKFRWVYQEGEHIIEEHSEYRIPLG